MSMMINPAGGDRTVAAGKPFTLRMPRKKPSAAAPPADGDRTEPSENGPSETDGTGADGRDETAPPGETDD